MEKDDPFPMQCIDEELIECLSDETRQREWVEEIPEDSLKQLEIQ